MSRIEPTSASLSASHVHGFFTAALYDKLGWPIPAGIAVGNSYGGTLLFQSNTPQPLKDYDVFHSLSDVAMGPLSHSYEYIGKVHELWAELSVYSDAEEQEVMSRFRDEVYMDERTRDIRYLCGFGVAVGQYWAVANRHGKVDLYVQTVGQEPADMVAHYGIGVSDPTAWCCARIYSFFGVVRVPIPFCPLPPP